MELQTEFIPTVFRRTELTDWLTDGLAMLVSVRQATERGDRPSVVPAVRSYHCCSDALFCDRKRFIPIFYFLVMG